MEKKSLPVIGLDLDGVIIDFTTLKQAVAAELGYSLTAKDTVNSRMRTFLPHGIYRTIQQTIYDERAQEASPVPGALESLKILQKSEFPLMIISRRKTPVSAKKWIKDHGVTEFIPAEKINFVLKDEEKDIVARACEVKIFLDDSIEVLNFLKSVPHKYLFDPFSNFDGKLSHPTISSWEAFIEVIKNLYPSKISVQ